MLRREGSDPRVSEIFFRMVAQVVLFFGLETGVLSEEMERKVEGTHTGFLRHITGKRARRIADVIWEDPRAEVVWEEAVTQSAMTYIGRR